MSYSTKFIKVAARSSALSKAQVKEVQEAINRFSPVEFDVQYLLSKGDLDKKTSLRALEKTDFFTKEIDALVLDGTCRIAIHSAKDLPEPLTAGLNVVALTQGLDPRDALVLREGEVLQKGFVIATSSERREESVRELEKQLRFVDIRGTIEERLQVLMDRKVDGVVIAEAALIRLGLNPTRLLLPGKAAPLQGRLAIVARSEDREMKELFKPLEQGQ